ncbi:MAG: ABC transporter substrate-binding protein, partial [Flavobacteriales bacterium]
IKNLDGALSSLSQQGSDVFYWEKFTTKPYVDSGQLKRIGEFITPWPCFQIAARQEVIAKHPEALKSVLKSIYFISQQFMNSLDAVEQVSKRYNLELADAEQWFFCTEWSTQDSVSQKMIQNVVYTLNQTGILGFQPKFEDLVVQL